MPNQGVIPGATCRVPGAVGTSAGPGTTVVLSATPPQELCRQKVILDGRYA